MPANLAEEARRLQARQARQRQHRTLPSLWLVTDGRRLPDPLPAVAALPRGSGVIFRHYEAPGRGALAAALARLCRRRGVLLLVAGDARLAAAVGAAGVHLPEAEGYRATALKRQRPTWVVSIAAHSLPALKLKRARVADFTLLSPVFATRSHPGAITLGPLRFASLCRQSPVRVVALGGINGATASLLHGARHSGLAAIDGLLLR
jgi:thiamine-phosphate pyrophosphorylase